MVEHLHGLTTIHGSRCKIIFETNKKSILCFVGKALILSELDDFLSTIVDILNREGVRTLNDHFV